MEVPDDQTNVAIRVHLRTDKRLSYRETAPLLDALNERFLLVEAERWNFKPPAAAGGGGPDVIVSLVFASFHGMSRLSRVLGDADMRDLVKAVVVELVKGSNSAVRKEIVRLIALARARRVTAHSAPFRIEIESLPFYFDEEVTEDEFIERCKRASDFVGKLPMGDLSVVPGPGEYGFYWDGESNGWKGPRHVNR